MAEHRRNCGMRCIDARLREVHGHALRVTCWVVIPVKPPPDRKTRLAGHLDAAARDDLVRRMAAHVAAAGAAAPGIDRVTLLTAVEDCGSPSSIAILADAGGGLNPALVHGMAEVAAAGATRVVIVAGDLPRVTSREIALLAAVRSDAAAIAPDRHSVGTNALSLPLPRAAEFRFAFGADSLARHRAEIARLGLDIVEVRSEGLARDVDLPDDLADAADLMRSEPARSATSERT